MNNAIVSRTVTGPGLKSRPPMATRCEPSQRAILRARDQQAEQRINRGRAEAMALLSRMEPEEWLPQRDKEPELPPLDPALNAEFIAGLITGLALSAVVAGALLIGSSAMSGVVMEAIAELARQNRELAARVTALEHALTEDRERLNAHGLLLTTPHRRDVVRHYEAQLAQVREAA